MWSLVPLATAPRALAASDPTYRYTKTFVDQGVNSLAEGTGTATDSLGNVYLTGYFLGTVTFGGSDTLTTQNQEAFITKYDKNGDYLWTKVLDSSTGNSSSSILNIAIDANNNVYLVGTYTGTVIFDGPGGSHSITVVTAQNDTDAFLTKLNANGSYGWTKTLGVSNGDIDGGVSVALDDANGYIYEAGQFSGIVAFDGQGGTDTKPAGGDHAVYVTKYKLADGSYVSTQVIAGTSSPAAALAPANGNIIAVDSAGNVYLAGTSVGTVYVNGTSQSFTSTDDQSFLAKFNDTGAYVWGRSFGNGNSGAFSNNYAVAAFGNNVYLVGDFNGQVAFDGPGGTATMTSGSSYQTSYVAAYSTGGTYEWVKTVGISDAFSWARATVVTTDDRGGIYIGGVYNGTAIFDGQSGSDTQNAGVNGTTADYLTKLDPSGAYDWSRVLYPVGGSSGTLQANVASMGISADDLGNVYLSGNFNGQVTFDGPSGSDTQTSASNDDAFLTSYNAFVPLPPAPSVPGAPDTGYVRPVASNFLSLVVVCVLVMAAGVFGLKRSHGLR